MTKNYKGRNVRLNQKTLKIEIENYLSMIEGFYDIKIWGNINDVIKTSIFTSTHDAIAIKNGLKHEPQLLTLIRKTKSRYPHNDKIFNQFDNYYSDMYVEFYLEKSPHYSRQSFQYLSDILHGKILYHHIAFIDKIYHIESLWKDEEKEFNKQKNLWKLLCSIGIFNQWKWCAPFNRYLKENSPKFIGSDCVTNEPPKEYMKYFTKNPMILLLRIYSIKRPFSFIYGDLEASDRWDEICKEIERHHIEIEKEVIEDEEFNKIQKHLEETLKECEIDYEIENVDYTCWED